jgi:hypothetical protein
MGEAAVTPSIDRSKWFYAAMGVTCLSVAVIGFMPSFFLPLAQGAFVRPPVFYLHGLLFFTWTLFFCAQTWLVASGRTIAHRDWGVLGAAIAALMAFSVMTVVVVRLNQSPPIPAGPGSASFSWVDVSGMAFFETCVALAIMNIRRPEVHKRLMLLATMSLLNAAIARWGEVIFGPPQPGPPPFIVEHWFNLAATALMLLPMVFDQRTQGRISRVYLVGVPVYVLIYLSWDVVGFSPAWLGIAGWIRHLAG